MKILKHLIHSLVLSVVNLGAIVCGFLIYKASGAGAQIPVQVPVAIVLSVLGFGAWIALTHRGRTGLLRLDSLRDGLWIYLLAFLWAPAIFLPLHFLIRGYLTSWGNLQAGAVFQLFANLFAVSAAMAIALQGKRRRECHG